MNKQKTVDFTGLIDELKLKPIGSGGWFTAKDLLCPECNKADGKFGIKRIEEAGLVNCWRCGYKDSLFGYLYKVGKHNFIHHGKKYEYTANLENVFAPSTNEIILPEIKLPYGFKIITYDEYLAGRGFTKYQYEQFKVGITDHPLEPKWNNKLLFQIFVGGKLVGILGRSRMPKEWHDENMALFKAGEAALVLRYNNSTETDFSHIVGGHDDICAGTETIIMVEGIFDKTNIDKFISIRKQSHTRCVFTFGSAISPQHIKTLKDFKNVREFILIYDPDALKKMRNYVNELQANFDFVYIGILNDDKDPAKLNKKEFSELLKNLKTPDEFYSSVIIQKKLKINGKN